jgi:hypothetical protein
VKLVEQGVDRPDNADHLHRDRAVLRWQGKALGTVYCALGACLALQER